MSKHRINPKAGWAKPDGKCRWCKGDVPGRQTFCTSACVHEWKLRSQPGYVRDHVEARDRGVCAVCGLDTEAFRAEVRDLRHADRENRLAAKGFRRSALHAGDYWQADHIVEVVKGGGGCGLENYQTLCTPCHKAKTKRLARELVEARKAAKEALFRRLLSGSKH